MPRPTATPLLRSRLLRCAPTLSILGMLGACGVAPDGEVADAPDCPGGKCDTPSGPADQHCEDRQGEVLDSSNRGYTAEGTIRWACADVEGVNAVGRDDRGQEYCEYYAIVQPPLQEGEPEAFDLGRQRRLGGVTDTAICVEGEDGIKCRTEITEDQLFELEDNPTDIIGACVFTSWHRDVPGPLPVCADGGCGDDATVFGFPLDEEHFRMKVRFNSNRAAADLIEKCFELDDLAPEPDFSDEDNPNNDPFFRGCMGVGNLFGTEWRRSDPSICAAVNRLAECGCGAPGVDSAKALGDVVVPPQPGDDGRISLRGFRLGTWDDPTGLPPGCRYAAIGEDTKTVVLCDLTAADVLENLQDPKEVCRDLYGPNVVVHVDLPVDALTCDPPDDEIGATCGARPWNLGAENEGVDPDPDPDPDPEPDVECGLHLAEVFYDHEGSDKNREWVKLYNSCDDAIDLAGHSLGWGGSSYAKAGIDLEGEVEGKSCFIIGGPLSGDTNGSPVLGQDDDLKPDLQNSGKEADGVALFDVLEDDVTSGLAPIDAVIYGEENSSGLLLPNGQVGEPHVGDAPQGSSIVRTGVDRWEISDTPRAADCPDF